MDVIITDELNRRSSRSPDHQAENQALRGLADAMANGPGAVLQRLAEAAMALTRSGSAGISVLEPGGEHGILRCVAASGVLARYRGSAPLPDASLCSGALARNEVLLLPEPGRCPLFPEAGTVVHEALLAPFRTDGKPAGAVWAAKHGPKDLFEREDARFLESLARFAAAAHQMTQVLEGAQAASEQGEAEAALRQGKERQALLLRLSDAVRTASDPAEIEQTAVRMLGEQLGLARAYYFDVERDGHGWVHAIESAYQREPGQPSMVGRHSLRHFGAWMFEGFGRGEAVAVPDVSAIAALTAEETASYRALGVAAFVNVPFLKHGGYSAGISVHDAVPRAWTPAEVALIREVGERTWLAVERARAEAALRDSEARFRALATAGSYLIYRMSADWAQMYQLDGRDFLADTGEPITGWAERYILPEDLPHISAAIAAAIRDVAPFELEHRVRRADGSVGWVLSRAVPILDGDGGIVEWFGAGSDITPRKDAEEKARQSEELRRIALEGGGMGAWRWDLRERLIWGDARFLALWGHPSSDAPQPLALFAGRMSPEGAAETEALVTRTVEAGEEFDGQLEVVSGPTAGRWVRWRGRADGQDPWILHGVSFDVTDQRRTIAALRESEERQAFLLRLSDALRPHGDAAAIQGEACRVLGEHLAVDRAYYVEIDEAAGVATVARDYVTGRAPSLVGAHPVASFSWSVDILRRGECHVVADAQDSPVVPTADRAALAALGITACTGAPLVKDGVLVGALCVTVSHVRRWTEAEVGLLREAGERIWSAVERARAEAALRESEERLRQFGEASQDILWIRDAETLQWTYLTPAFETIYGLGREEAVAGDTMRNWADLIVPEDRERAVASVKRAGNGEHVTFEYRIRRPSDGQVRWLRNTDFPMLDDAGRVVRIGGVGQDVTELKTVEAAVAVSEERLRLALDIGQLATWDWDLATDAVVWNDAHYYMQGYEPGEVRPSFDLWCERLHPDDRGPTVAAVERARDRREEYVREFRNLLPGGAVRWTSARGRFFYDGQGRPTRMIGVMEDVTDRLEAEHALAAGEARLRTLTEGIPQLVWRANGEGLWTWASPQWTGFTGQAQEESHGLGWLDAVHPDDREAVARAREAARAHGLLDAEHRVRRASDGAWLWHHTRSVPVRDAEGRIVEWLGTSTDVQQLKGLQERQAVMVAELQHRTRNLIAVVRSIAGQTMARTGPTEAFREEFNHRLEALARVQGLLSRSDEEPITIEALIRMELDALGLKNGLAGRVAFGGPPARIRHSVVQTLALALHELATNARKHGALSTDAGRLHVRWQVREEDGKGRRLLLDWTEEGGPPPDPDTSAAARRGYGRELIERALPYTLDARTRYELDGAGVRCSIDMPLEKARSRRSSP